MSADEYNRMLFERMHSDRRWENQIADGWTIDDLDVAEIRNTVSEAVRIGRLDEPGSREPEDLLRGLGLIRDGFLFRAATVLFGNVARLERDLPQCLLRVARFRGVDRSEFLDNRQLLLFTIFRIASVRLIRDSWDSFSNKVPLLFQAGHFCSSLKFGGKISIAGDSDDLSCCRVDFDCLMSSRSSL